MLPLWREVVTKKQIKTLDPYTQWYIRHYTRLERTSGDNSHVANSTVARYTKKWSRHGPQKAGSRWQNGDECDKSTRRGGQRVQQLLSVGYAALTGLLNSFSEIVIDNKLYYNYIILYIIIYGDCATARENWPGLNTDWIN